MNTKSNQLSPLIFRCSNCVIIIDLQFIDFVCLPHPWRRNNMKGSNVLIIKTPFSRCTLSCDNSTEQRSRPLLLHVYRTTHFVMRHKGYRNLTYIHLLKWFWALVITICRCWEGRNGKWNKGARNHMFTKTHYFYLTKDSYNALQYATMYQHVSLFFFSY